VVSPLLRLRRALRTTFERFVHDFLKFGAVGLVGLVVDVSIFNLLRLGFFGHDPAVSGPLGAKTISVSLAVVVTWVGNRYWTFRAQRRKNFVLELLEFSAVAVLGLGISLACVYVSHYVFGFTSLLADNISTNVIGLGLATAVRFLLYRQWVYGSQRSDILGATSNADATPATR
jgi:putative flippase GtrA